jgi:CheY-like chemotaxis protein
VLDYLQGRGRFTGGGPARPDLILMDLNLPKRDGREVLSLIKSDPELRSIPVVIISTSDREEDVRRVLEGGAAAYISKSKGFDTYTAEIAGVTKYVRPAPPESGRS